MFDLRHDETADIQHDLAMQIASDDEDDLTRAMAAELERRGAALPINCRWQSDIYARGGKRLTYQLKGD